MNWNLDFLERYYNNYVYYDIEKLFNIDKTYTVSDFRCLHMEDSSRGLKAMHFILFINCIKYSKNYFKDE